MTRLEAVLGMVAVAAATFLVTDWVHYRVGNPPIFELLLGPGGGFETSSGHDPQSVTESQFQVYLRVLEAMQAERSLTIEDAVAAEHISLPQFRHLEQRVQHNEGLIERARHILRERAESLWNTRVGQLGHG